MLMAGLFFSLLAGLALGVQKKQGL